MYIVYAYNFIIVGNKMLITRYRGYILIVVNLNRMLDELYWS